MQEIRIEVSTKCMYDCTMCVRNEISRKDKIMSFETFNTILDNAMEGEKFRYVDFSGMGEPLTDKGLEDKIKLSVDKGLLPIVITNGLLLEASRFLSLKKAGVYYVRISYHGTSPERYLAAHSFNGSMKVLTNIAIANEMKQGKGKALPVKVGVYSLGTEDDAAILQKIMPADLDTLEVWRPHNWVDSMELRKVNAADMKKTCGRVPGNTLQVLVNGDVVPCCFDALGRHVLGNILTTPLAEIFKSPLARKLVTNHKSGKHLGTICERCDQRNAVTDGVLVYSSINSKDRLERTSSSYGRV